jgi:hypothetical protein
MRHSIMANIREKFYCGMQAAYKFRLVAWFRLLNITSRSQTSWLKIILLWGGRENLSGGPPFTLFSWQYPFNIPFLLAGDCAGEEGARPGEHSYAVAKHAEPNSIRFNPSIFLFFIHSRKGRIPSNKTNSHWEGVTQEDWLPRRDL